MRFKLALTFKLFFLCALLAFAGQAYALPITPDDAILWGNETGVPQIESAIESTIGSAVQLYKSNVGGSEEGLLAGSYETTFYNTPTDPSEALIAYISGDIVGPTAYLLVKDGNQSPAWYLFDLTALLWDGMEDLVLAGFWPDNGAISHVALYGTTAPVPEPATMLLLGTGLLGTAIFSRRKLLKKK
jgi:hypothetical protein